MLVNVRHEEYTLMLFLTIAVSWNLGRLLNLLLVLREIIWFQFLFRCIVQRVHWKKLDSMRWWMEMKWNGFLSGPLGGTHVEVSTSKQRKGNRRGVSFKKRNEVPKFHELIIALLNSFGWFIIIYLSDFNIHLNSCWNPYFDFKNQWIYQTFSNLEFFKKSNKIPPQPITPTKTKSI